MKLLKEYIEKNGKAIGTNILKVDSFLNHQIDPNLMMAMGEEFKRRFKDQEVNKILTIEASGIAIGLAAAYAFNVPLVFAKKKIPSTMGDFYTTNVLRPNTAFPIARKSSTIRTLSLGVRNSLATQIV